MQRAGSTTLDLRLLPATPPVRQERPELEPPEMNPTTLPGGPVISAPAPTVPGPNAPAPSTTLNFDGLDFATWGAGHPPDTNGDVGPAYYIQTVNTSIGVYRKSDQVRVAAFTFNTFMSQGHFGNLCDTNNFGDPVVLYDTFEDRWFITDFAFMVDGSGTVINPPGVFQCFAVSKTNDPVAGGWNFYSISIQGGLDDYPKFGIWPDGIYMSANMFTYGGSFLNPRVFALNKAQMYAGSPVVQVLVFDAPSSEFTLLPANARLQAGTPPAGSPNYYSVLGQFFNAISVYKFHVDWNSVSLSTFTGPFVALAPSSWTAPPASVPSKSGNSLDSLGSRQMVQNQYTNRGGVESLWGAHTVLGSTASQSAVRVYQTTVTGGTVASNTTQAFTYNPDATNRFLPSVAVDRAGDLALGYSTTSTTAFPAILYAGNLASDPLNTISETEVSLKNGTGTQSGNCGSGTCIRWGDYSAMTLDPDGCTFWYTNEYYAVTGLNDLTRIGAFAFPSCTSVGTGTIQGTVTATVGGAPIGGATVALGSRTTTTAGDGTYSFSGIASGTYPSITASAPGYNSSTVNVVVVTSSGTTTESFSLSTAPASACLTDTTQADFQRGVATNLDLTTSPGDAVLVSGPMIDQTNTLVTNNGFGFTSTSWAGQTFTPGVTGKLTRVDVDLFCFNCTGTFPNITVSIRATSGSPAVPTGADLATATIAGFNSGSGGYFTASFGSPPMVTAGTRYAIVIRAVSNPSAGTYAYTCSCSTDSNPYANGQIVTSTNSGGTWAADTTAGGRDMAFKVYIDAGFATSGDLILAVKDSNPAAGFTAGWTTLSWTAAVPANTTLEFQAAASNSQYGPFNFVGPDGTAATFFTTSGASLAQFNGNRYLRARAYFQTTDRTKSATLNDVTICFADSGGAPDLSLTKSDGGASVAPGGTVAYTLTYGNGGGANATGVVITETVPANTSFNAGASTAGWACSPNNNAGASCTLAIGTVTAGSTGLTATFAVTVVNPVPAGVTQIANTASIADDGTHGTDPNPGNNTGSDTTPLTGGPDLAIGKSDGGMPTLPGAVLAYTLTYANSGTRGATGVTVTETVPAHTTFNAGASTAGWNCTPNDNAGSTCTLTVGSVASGSGNLTAAFAVTVGNPLAASVTEIDNTATIGDDGANGTDLNPGNNSASTMTPVLSGLYYTVTPCRLLDTRNAPGAYGGPALAAGSTRTFIAAGQCGVAADAKALSYNITVTGGNAFGDLRVFPAAAAAPLVSVINYGVGQTRANNGVTLLGASGDFSIRSDQPSGSVQVIIDVNGYFK